MECSKDEAIKAKKIAEGKMERNDYIGAKKFALKAQNLYPSLVGIAQMLTTIEVCILADLKLSGAVNWYRVLGVDPSADDETLKKHYRKLALVLHPDKNNLVGADGAFKLLQEAWSLLSDKSKRLAYDQRMSFNRFQKVKTHKSGPSAPSGENGSQRSSSRSAATPKAQNTAAQAPPRAQNTTSNLVSLVIQLIKQLLELLKKEFTSKAQNTTAQAPPKAQNTTAQAPPKAQNTTSEAPPKAQTSTAEASPSFCQESNLSSLVIQLVLLLLDILEKLLLEQPEKESTSKAQYTTAQAPPKAQNTTSAPSRANGSQRSSSRSAATPKAQNTTAQAPPKAQNTAAQAPPPRAQNSTTKAPPKSQNTTAKAPLETKNTAAKAAPAFNQASNLFDQRFVTQVVKEVAKQLEKQNKPVGDPSTSQPKPSSSRKRHHPYHEQEAVGQSRRRQ